MGEKITSSLPPTPALPGKAALIAGLRSHILSLERHAPRRGLWAAEADPSRGHSTALPRPEQGWRLGCSAVDALLPTGFEAGALHEVKGDPSAAEGASAADWMAGFGFAVRLAIRRIDGLAAEGGAASRPWLLWCWPRSLSLEFGSPMMGGFLRLGLDASRLIVVETARASEALNAIEEGLKAQSLAVVIGALDEADLTPARRLSIAAGETATPCLLVTHPASEPAAATATRWRVQRQPSAPHSFDPRAPGATRFSISLERCKARPESAAQPAVLVEWSDETRRFNLASVMADLPAETRRAGGSAFSPAIRSR
ncbi:hypothetical protein [Hyphomicrobium sp.]|uniref:ImuA family protein n=1 Tax=Hyphomicrobium sp. TaxID=82 RepID=UPI000FBEE9A4|nr:hypothetical protein [Hyphomicrobium sp.]RUO99629.1 MAG: hypothetical protein EKK30_07035 [Hyphomicrobium sp.]